MHQHWLSRLHVSPDLPKKLEQNKSYSFQLLLIITLHLIQVYKLWLLQKKKYLILCFCEDLRMNKSPSCLFLQTMRRCRLSSPGTTRPSGEPSSGRYLRKRCIKKKWQWCREVHCITVTLYLVPQVYAILMVQLLVTVAIVGLFTFWYFFCSSALSIIHKKSLTSLIEVWIANDFIRSSRLQRTCEVFHPDPSWLVHGILVSVILTSRLAARDTSGVSYTLFFESLFHPFSLVVSCSSSPTSRCPAVEIWGDVSSHSKWSHNCSRR